MQVHTLQYGASIIEFSLVFSERKTLGIKVHPDVTVEVQAPFETSIDKVKEKVKNKASWILKQKDFFLAFHPLTPPRLYVSGETHMYLGKQYRLKLITSKVEYVKLKNGYIHVGVKNQLDKLGVKKLLHKWYLEKAKIHFEAIFKKNLPLTKKLSDKEVLLKYRWMTKRWGSCDSKGTIHLNVELMKASKKCIEYVMIHEMCHLKYFNHSSKFYTLLESILPNYKETKQTLELVIV